MVRAACARPGVRLCLWFLIAMPAAARAQTLAPDGRVWYGVRAGLLRLHAVDDAASPLRYRGTDRPVELAIGRTGARAGWELWLGARRAALSSAGGSADERRLSLGGWWSLRVLGSRGSGPALRLGACGQGLVRQRTQRYTEQERSFPQELVAAGPRATLEWAGARDALDADLEVMAVAFGQQAYGANVAGPWRLEALGPDLRSGGLTLSWWHALGPRWRSQLGGRLEALRVGRAPVVAQTGQGVLLGLVYEPGRRP